MAGKKKGGGKKRKRNNVWEDYNPNDASDDVKPKKKSGESMLGQWKKKKIAMKVKRKDWYQNVEEKKAAQFEMLQLQRKKEANKLYEHLQHDASLNEDDVDSDVDAVKEEEDASSSSDEERVVNKKSSIFNQFIATFQPSTKERHEDDEKEEEYEEFEADEEEFTEGDGTDEESLNEEGREEDEDGVDEEDSVDKKDSVDEEEEFVEADDVNDVPSDDEEQMDNVQDAYRERYILAEFSDFKAKQVNEASKKLASYFIPTSTTESISMGLDIRFRGHTLDGTKLMALEAPASDHRKVNVRSRLMESWKAKGIAPQEKCLSTLQRMLFAQMSSYMDVFFAAQTYENTNDLRRTAMMHVINHVVKSRDTVTRNNERLRKAQHRREAIEAEQKKEKKNSKKVLEKPTASFEQEEEIEYRDQGFCRPTILLLAPLRSSAVKIVELLLELLPHTVDTFHNKDRFFEEYGDQDEGGGNENENDAEYRNNKSEWEKIFAEGNNDDAFQIGISLSRKALRFYSEYHHADIILASPLGLRQQLGDEVAEIASKQRLSSDFLSSIEVCVIDSASVIMMQNLDHLRSILSAVNLQPGEASKADFSRIREWNLSFFAKYFRQTILFAHGIEPSLNNLMNKSCSNFGGMIRYMRKYDTSDGSCSITRVVPQVKQIFQRIDVGHSSMTLEEETDARFEYFKKNIFEPLLEQQKKHLLIFIPSYFDYVRIRNLFGENKKLIRFVNCCEYTQNKEISRSRSAFYHGKANAMLFTERFHFYRQYRIRGVHQIVWYGVPCIGDFYPDMLNMLGGSGTSEEEMSSIALFSKFDLYRMQRIVGGKRAQRMCNPSAKKPTYLFC